MKEGDSMRDNRGEKDAAGRWLAPGYPPFRYSENGGLACVFRINLGRSANGETFLEVVSSQHGGGGYEFGIRQGGKITAHSDAGYGTAETALRDGLIVWEGLPDGPIEVSRPETGEKTMVWPVAVPA